MLICCASLAAVSIGMRILVMLLLDTLPMLGNVLLLCFFVFFIFGIVGVQLWTGLLRYRCYLNLPANVSAEGYAFIANCIPNILQYQYGTGSRTQVPSKIVTRHLIDSGESTHQVI